MEEECKKCRQRRIERYIQWVKGWENKMTRDYGLREFKFGKIIYVK